ncbi:MAG: DUF3299 domain-containing protein [Phycisphaeraceae bacterium]|nr:DUF3299 domain-containing protein [Phycisphaeraceae bacterium]MBX3407651.1 DUF3299 domain-containing protein [Phycisphaeraceae bacterium]
MRIFWTIIALLVLATVAMLYARGRARPPAPAPVPAPAQAADTPRPTPPAERPVPAQPIVDRPLAPSAPDPSHAPPPRTPQVAETPAPVEDPNPAPAIELPVVPERDVAASTEHLRPGFVGPPPPGAPEVAADDATIREAPFTDSAANTAAPTPAAAGAREPSAADSAATIAAAQGPAKLEPQPDGTVLVDGRFVMRGDGSRDKPYEVTWEHLMSVQETYKPRMGLKVIPDRVQMLHNKWVKISGYVAFPVMAEGLDEMLMMLNQWDGCCIGVPPTPFDAIEVKLDKPAEGETRLLIMGTVTGKLQVDPYLVKDWLVSLYLMDDTVVGKQSGAPLRESEVRQEHLAP